MFSLFAQTNLSQIESKYLFAWLIDSDFYFSPFVPHKTNRYEVVIFPNPTFKAKR